MKMTAENVSKIRTHLASGLTYQQVRRKLKKETGFTFWDGDIAKAKNSVKFDVVSYQTSPAKVETNTLSTLREVALSNLSAEAKIQLITAVLN